MTIPAQEKADTPPTMIKRDQYDRPLIVPPGGGKPIGYARTSTFAKALSDVSGLTRWQLRQLAKGMLIERATPSDHADPTQYVPLHLHPDQIPEADRNKWLDAKIAQANEIAGTHEMARRGTAIHGLTEWADNGEEFEEDAEGFAEYMPFVREYQRLTEGLEMLSVETFCVQDDVQVAGTFDRLVRLHDGRVVCADLKTGSSTNKSPWETAVQIATYANSMRYNPETYERTPIHPDLDRSVGLLIHIPSNGGKSGLYELDLEAGWRAADLAVQVRNWRKSAIIEPYYATKPPF